MGGVTQRFQDRDCFPTSVEIHPYFNNQCAYQWLNSFMVFYLGSLSRISDSEVLFSAWKCNIFDSKRFLLSIFCYLFPLSHRILVCFFFFFFNGWPWLVMLPSSSPKRVNYYWSGKTISKIISCVAFDENNCQGTDLVLGLEISSPEPLLWEWSLEPRSPISASLSFTQQHW